MSDTNESLWNASGRYVDVKEVGHGAQGEVFRAFDKELKRQVAIKTARLDNQCETSAARFHQEILALSKLDHPNVVTLLEEGCVESHCFYVMEYVEGSDLMTYIEKERPPLEDVIQLFLTICRALQAIHNEGVLHRDIKPENICVTSQGVPYIIDFGLVLFTAQEVERMTRTGHFVGTLTYMAPEVLLSAEYSPASDVYQVGVLLYKAMCKQLPLSPMAIIALARGDEVRPSSIKTQQPDLDGALAQIIDKSVAYNVVDRYQSADELAADLEGWSPSTEVVEAYTGETAFAPAPTKRNPLPLIFFTLFFVFLLLRSWLHDQEIEVQGLRLQSLTKLTLLFQGKPNDDCFLALKRPGQKSQKISLSLNDLQRLPADSWALVVPLAEPLVKPTEVTFVGCGLNHRVLINPKEKIEDVLESVADLKKDLGDTLSWCRSARQNLFVSQESPQHPSKRDKTKKELLALLSRRGLDEAKIKALSLLLPQLVKSRLSITATMEERLLPLRFIESTMCSHGSVAPPWPSVTALSGLRFEKPSLPLERKSWEVIGRLGMTNVIEDKASWTWISDNDKLQDKRTTGFDDLMISLTIKKIIHNRSVTLPSSERYPTLNVINRRVLVEVAVPLTYKEKWPPKSCLLAIELRLLHPTTSLLVRLNGCKPIHVTQPGVAALPPIKPVQDHQRVLVPIRGEHLRLGKNKLSFETKTMPGQIPHWLVAIREVALLIPR